MQQAARCVWLAAVACDELVVPRPSRPTRAHQSRLLTAGKPRQRACCLGRACGARQRPSRRACSSRRGRWAGSAAPHLHSVLEIPGMLMGVIFAALLALWIAVLSF